MPAVQRNLFILCITIAGILCQKNGCELSYIDFPHREPVFYKSNLSVIEPNYQAILLKTNQEVIIACPGAKNSLLLNGNRETRAVCVGGETLKINGNEYDLSRLNCSKDVVGEVNVTGSPCGNKRGIIKNIGHSLSNKKYNILFTICYDNDRGETIFANHIIYGSAIKYSKKDSSRPGFKTSGLGPGVAADVSYKQITQKSTFSKILGSSKLADQYIFNRSHDRSYLARGHLAPDGDFVYVSSQHSSYFYINTLPQWQVINNGNWKSLEFAIRHVAADTKKNLHVWTGGYQTLKLPDTDGNPQEIYLVPLKKLLPVPKFVWKVVYDPQSKSGIAFVTINNPFIKTLKKEDILCKDVCEDYNWNVPAWKNPAKGYTYCCNINELKKIIDTIPYIGNNKILKITTTL